jgi:3-dehydro-L-gulonate 2-dehydrogenase
MRVGLGELKGALEAMLLRLEFAPERAAMCARLFAETTCDGVYTHGLARFPRFVATVRLGVVKPAEVPTKVSGLGALERWDGNLGPGNLNAWTMMERAMVLARTHGIGAVALRNTNHWMRGGTYGWQAADAGMFAMCWTNTLPNVPAWGALKPTAGNNPMVMAVPRVGGNVVLDMAMSQYSYGTLEQYMKREERLPFPGGFDTRGELTTDAGEIWKTNRALPIGMWKGSGLSMALDLFAAMLSGGKATHEIPKESLKESGLSQMFLAVDPSAFGVEEMQATADAVIANLHGAEPVEAGRRVRYPGEETLRVRRENMEMGVPVDEGLWEQLVEQRYA